MNHYRLILIALLATVVLPVAAQVYEPTYEKILIPIPAGETPGAFGSIWTATIAVSNISNAPVDVQGHGRCPADGFPCRPAPIPPQATSYIRSLVRSEVPASFLFVEPNRVADVSVSIRVFDRSREHLTWGASIPVVTRKELFAGPFGIGDIPVSDEFRSMLRIYDFDATTPAAVRVRVYAVTPATSNEMDPGPADALLADFRPSFTVATQGGTTFFHPGYAAIPLWLIPEVAGAARVRVVIEPLDATGDYWAMVSSTHNATQHVTVLPPR
jgi:hypothetical protein